MAVARCIELNGEMVDRDETFVRLFVANQGRIFRYVLTLVANRADAEEIYQETSLLLWKKWAEFEPGRDFTRWACGIAFNVMRGYLRKRDRRHTQLDEDLLQLLSERWFTRQALLDRQQHALIDCLEKLPPDQRRLVENCYGHDATAREVAEENEQSVHVVYKTLRRIRLALLECVQRRLALDGGAA
jgi:RNA polymerase sigma-70 factor (ECF subfamily)